MKHKERGNTHMAKEQLIFCGSSETFLDKALTADSNADNGGNAFRIPSLVNADGTLIAAIDRASCGADWGYIELAVRRSEDGGKRRCDPAGGFLAGVQGTAQSASAG